MSLRRRVIVGFVAVAAVLVIANVALFSTFRGFLLNRVDHQLVANGATFGRRDVIRVDPGESQRRDVLTEYFVARGDPNTGVLTQVNSLFSQEERPPPALRIDSINQHLTGPGEDIEPYTARAESGTGKWRMIAVYNPFDEQVTVLGVSLDSMNDTLAHARNVQLLGTLAVLAALGLVLSWTIRLGVTPVAAMADTAEKISAGDLSVRVDHPDESTEVGRLGSSFNAMLDRIEQAFRDREASEARVRRFAADASHELRTPLTSIRGYAELWRAGALEDPAALADAMGRVEAEAQRMGLLVEELLQLARLDQEQEMVFAPVDLAELAGDAVADARAVEPDRPIELTVEPVVVNGNDPALRQVVANLLANVRSHTPAGTPASVSVRSDGTDAIVVVADEGPGMPDDVAAHVFERFYRADVARTRAAGGTGLGLAIVESIARAHGGTATVTTAPGEGTRFEFRIPASH